MKKEKLDLTADDRLIDVQVTSGGHLLANQFSKMRHPRLPQYTIHEVQSAIKVFETLIRWRDEAREKGLIEW